MPRRSVAEDDDDTVPLSDLLRTGEASRLRRRGAMRATTTHRRDDDDDDETSSFPFPRSIKGGELYLALECGVRSRECSFISPGPSQPSPLPRSPSLRKPADVGVIFSSTGCGSVVSTKAFPGSLSAKHVYISTEPVSSDVVNLHHKYLEPEKRTLVETIMKDSSLLQGDWQAIGCRVCGNALGLLYATWDPRTSGITSSTYVFFPSAVTPSPDVTFPPALHPESDDISVDSPTLSPRMTRYFRSDDELWPNDTNRHWGRPDREFTRTPPRSPPTEATPLAYAAWHGVLAPAQMQPSRTATDRQLTPNVPGREPFWQTFFSAATPPRTEQPLPQNINDATYTGELVPQPPPSSAAAPSHEPRDHASTEGPSVSRTETRETVSRALEPPSLHRVSRRPTPSMMRRPTTLIDWSSRGRHIPPSDANAWGVQASDERFLRRVPSRRISMPMPAPPPAHAPRPTFTLLDAFGERSYPPSARSSLDARDTLSVSMEVETEDAAIAHWLMQARESDSPAERSWNHHPDEENEEVGGDDSEEKDDDLDERRGERLSRNDLTRTASHSGSLRGLVSR